MMIFTLTINNGETPTLPLKPSHNHSCLKKWYRILGFPGTKKIMGDFPTKTGLFNKWVALPGLDLPGKIYLATDPTTTSAAGISQRSTAGLFPCACRKWIHIGSVDSGEVFFVFFDVRKAPLPLQNLKEMGMGYINNYTLYLSIGRGFLPTG